MNGDGKQTLVPQLRFSESLLELALKRGRYRSRSSPGRAGVSPCLAPTRLRARLLIGEARQGCL